MAARGEAEASAKRGLCASGAYPPQGQRRHFIVSLTFLLLIDALGRSGTFFFYAAIGLLTLWFCWKLVPETKGKRLEEIEDIFKERAARSAG